MGVLAINSLSMPSELKFNTESGLRQSAVTSPPTTRYQLCLNGDVPSNVSKNPLLALSFIPIRTLSRPHWAECLPEKEEHIRICSAPMRHCITTLSVSSSHDIHLFSPCCGCHQRNTVCGVLAAGGSSIVTTWGSRNEPKSSSRRSCHWTPLFMENWTITPDKHKKAIIVELLRKWEKGTSSSIFGTRSSYPAAQADVIYTDIRWQGWQYSSPVHVTYAVKKYCDFNGKIL